MTERPRDLTRALLGVLCIGVLIAAALWIVRPFFAAGIWATTIVVVTWPLLIRMQRRLFNKRSLAAASMILMLVLVFVIPLALGVGAVVAHADDIAGQIRSITTMAIPPLPDWVAQLPLIGAELSAAWLRARDAGIEAFLAQLGPYASGLTAWLFAEIGTAGYLIAQLVLIPVFAAFMYLNGEKYAGTLLRFGYRVGAKQGESLIMLAAHAIRGVALGVGLTAIIQAALGGIGLAAAGVPFAGILTAVLLVLCISQIGMLVLLIPAVIWVFWNGDPGWGIFLAIWSFVASMLDTVLRPILVSRSADLPLLLIFVGVIGGFLAFGLLGIFVGPVVLAVAYTFLKTWIEQAPATKTPTAVT